MSPFHLHVPPSCPPWIILFFSFKDMIQQLIEMGSDKIIVMPGGGEYIPSPPHQFILIFKLCFFFYLLLLIIFF